MLRVITLGLVVAATLIILVRPPVQPVLVGAAAAGQTIGYIGYHFITTHVHTQLRRDGQLVAPDAWWSEWDGR